MRRPARLAIAGVAALLASAATLIVAVWIFGNTDGGRTWIERLTYRLTSGHVKLTGLGGSFPARLELAQLELSDARGVWLTAERLKGDWAPLELLWGEIRVGTLQAAKVHMERLPVSTTPASTNKVSIPHIDVAALSVAVVELGPELAGAPASLTLDGDVRLRSLDEMAGYLTARRIGGDGEYALRAGFDLQRMDADLKLHEPAGGPLEHLLGLPGLGALSATVSLHGLRKAEHLELVLDAGEAHARARGDVNLGAYSADLDYSLEAPAMAPRPDLSWQRIGLHGRWHGSLITPAADGQLAMEQLRLPGGTAVATLNAALTASGGSLGVRADVGGLRIAGPQPRLFADAPLTIDATMKMNDARRTVVLLASHRLFRLRAEAVTAGAPSVSLQVNLTDVAPFAALAGADAQGTATLDARLSQDGAITHIGLDATAALADGRSRLSVIAGNRVTLALSAALGPQRLEVERLQLSADAGALELSGSASRPVPGSRANAAPGAARSISDFVSDLRARWEVKMSNLGVLSTGLAGTLTASGDLRGAPLDLGLTAQVAATVSVHGSPPGAIDAKVQARGLPTLPSGSVQAQGTLDGAPLQLDVAVDRDTGGVFHALIRQADWKSVHAGGDLLVQPQLTQSHGQIRLQIGQLSDLKRLLGINIEGSVDGDFGVKPVDGSTRMALRVDGRNLVIGRMSGNAQLTGAGPWNALGLQLSAELPDSRGAAAKITASALANLDTKELRLTDLAADYQDQTARLLSAALLSFGDGLAVEEIRLGAGDAVLEFGGRVLPSLDLHGSLHGLGPAQVDAFVPELLSAGTIDGDVRLQGAAGAPTGEIHLNALGLRLADIDTSGLPALDLHASAQLNGAMAKVDANLSAGRTSLLTITGDAPLDADGTLDMKISGKPDLSLVNPLLEAHGQQATGHLVIEATLGGSANAPQIEGKVGLAAGTLRDYGRGFSLTDITAQAVGSEGMLRIQSFTAKAASGSVSMSGTIGVLQPKLPLDLKITARNAQPIASNLITANLDADLTVKGTAREQIDVAGSVRLNRTTIGIPNSLPPDVAVLDVRRRGRKPPPPVKPLLVGLDITVSAPQQILVRGRGLNAVLAGDLHIGGTADLPVVTGGFDLQNGTFSIAGNPLTLVPPGSVSFDGAGLKNKIDPTLNFTAQTTVLDITATVKITGLADAPKFEFSSNNSTLGQDEIMDYLLFGEPSTQLSGLQLAQSSLALAELSGVGGNGGFNPITKLQKTLGLDRLSVGANTVQTVTGTTTSGANIQAGRYVSKRVYVELKQSTAGSSQVQVDVDLTKHLKLQTRLGNGTAITQGTTPENDPGSSVGLSYQFEY